MFSNAIFNSSSPGGNRVGLRWQSGNLGRKYNRGYFLNDTFLNYSSNGPYGVFPTIPVNEYDPDNIHSPITTMFVQNNNLYIKVTRFDEDDPSPYYFYTIMKVIPQYENSVITGYNYEKVENDIEDESTDFDTNYLTVIYGGNFDQWNDNTQTTQVIKRAEIFNSPINVSYSAPIGNILQWDYRQNPGHPAVDMQWDCYTPFNASIRPLHETMSATFGSPKLVGIRGSDDNIHPFVLCRDIIIGEIRNEYYVAAFEQWKYHYACIPRPYISLLP